VDWNIKLQFNKERKYIFNIFKRKGRHALVTNIRVFWNCSLEQRDISYAILNLSKAKRGQIWYNIKSSRDLYTKQCVVVRRNSCKDKHRPRNKKYYILVVRLTSVDSEYTRVGVKWVQNNYIVRQRLNI
jgi:hypothetical protein